jgi:hypothetical protein
MAPKGVPATCKEVLIMKREIWIYRLYDCAEEFDLGRLEKTLAEKIPLKRLRLSRAKSTSILMEHPPLTSEMKAMELTVGETKLAGSVLAKFYRLGIVTLIFRLAIPDDMSYNQLRELAVELSSGDAMDNLSRQRYEELKKSIEGTFTPSRRPGFTEDFTLFFFPSWPVGWDPVPLLLAEEEEPSEQSREDTLKNSFSYGKKDLTIITWDTALVVDEEQSTDIPDIIEFALTQLLLLRFYDGIITEELEKMHTHVGMAATRGFYSRLKRYRQITKKLMETVMEVTEITEKVQNSFKVTEDVFYARVYNAAQNVFATHGWYSSIERKVKVIQETYHLLKSEIETQSSHLLEITIILLIFIEIIMGLCKLL